MVWTLDLDRDERTDGQNEYIESCGGESWAHDRAIEMIGERDVQISLMGSRIRALEESRRQYRLTLIQYRRWVRMMAAWLRRLACEHRGRGEGELGVVYQVLFYSRSSFPKAVRRIEELLRRRHLDG